MKTSRWPSPTPGKTNADDHHDDEEGEEEEDSLLVSLARRNRRFLIGDGDVEAQSREIVVSSTSSTSPQLPAPRHHEMSHDITPKESPPLLDDATDDKEARDDDPPRGSGRYLAIQILPEKRLNASIGACLYDSSNNTLFVLGKSTASYGDTAFLLELIRTACGPCEAVVVSAKTREADLEELQRQHGGGKVQIRPTGWFDYTRAAHILSRSLGDNPYALGASFDLSNRASVESAGAVLLHAEQLGDDYCSNHDDDAGGVSHLINTTPRLSVEMFDLERFMCIDATSLTSLDIVKAEEHPSQIRGRGRAKEGFSLLALLDRAKSPTGSATLRRWVSRPLARREEIEARHDAVEFLLDSRRQDLRLGLVKLLRNVQDAPRSFLRIKRCEATWKDWIAVCESLMNIELALTNLKFALMEVVEETVPALLIDIVSGTCEKLSSALQRVVDVFDWELTRTAERLVPHEGIDEALDAARARAAALPALLERETAHELTKSGGTFRFIPAIGFVIGVEAAAAAAGDDDDDDERARKRVRQRDDSEFTFQFQAEIRASESEMNDEGEGKERRFVRFYKNNRARLLDEEVGDPFAAVSDLEASVTRRAELSLLELESEMLLASHRASELDALLCFVEVSMDFGYVRPQMSDESHLLRLKGARHPLLDRLEGVGGRAGGFVPHDVEVKRGRTVTIITGPNYSGKSVVLKTVVLLCVMAQIGCFVPAEEAEIGVVDRVFTRLNSLETVGSVQLQNESSFSIDVQQIALMLKNCTPNSLLVVDEFGKGTASLDGISLLAATVRHLTTGGVGPVVPRTFITTHLLEIFELFSLDERANQEDLAASDGAERATHRIHDVIQRCEMQVEFQVGSRIPIPLFRMRVMTPEEEEKFGQRGESYGVACARRAGVKASVCGVAERAVEENALRLFNAEFLVERFEELNLNASRGTSSNAVSSGTTTRRKENVGDEEEELHLFLRATREIAM